MRSSSMTRRDLREIEEEFKTHRDEGRWVVVFLVVDPSYRRVSEMAMPRHLGPAHLILQADFVVHNSVLVKNRFAQNGLRWPGLDKFIADWVPGTDRRGFHCVRFSVPPTFRYPEAQREPRTPPKPLNSVCSIDPPTHDDWREGQEVEAIRIVHRWKLSKIDVEELKEGENPIYGRLVDEFRVVGDRSVRQQERGEIGKWLRGLPYKEGSVQRQLLQHLAAMIEDGDHVSKGGEK